MRYTLLLVLVAAPLLASAIASAETAPPLIPGVETCCCFRHPQGSPCVDGWPRSLCTGTDEFPWKVCATPSPTNAPTPNPTQGPTNAPTPFPTRFPTRQPTPFPTRFPTQNPTRFPTQGPTPFPTRFPTRQPTNFPTRFPTQFPTRQPTRFPTRAPTPSPTPAPTPGPVCDCIFDPSKPPLGGFPIEICEGPNQHRCVCEGCDYTFNRADCVEWVQFDILEDTFWPRGVTALIKGEIHVKNGARLTIESGSVVLFEDWPVSTLLDRPRPAHTTSPWSVLVVDSGSSIDAREVAFESKTRGGSSLNGGLVIAGRARSFTHPLYPTIQSVAARRRNHAQSQLYHVRFNGVGNSMTAPQGALTVIGADNTDVSIKGLYVGGASGPAFSVIASDIEVYGLTVAQSTTGIMIAGDSTLTVSGLLQATNVWMGAYIAAENDWLIIDADTGYNVVAAKAAVAGVEREATEAWRGPTNIVARTTEAVAL